MSERRYHKSIFDVVEYIIEIELLVTSKRLIARYLDGSSSGTMAGKARDAITRYTQKSIPTLEEIREKSKSSKLCELDHLILKMEYASKHFYQ